jgi:hypothetical protein
VEIYRKSLKSTDMSAQISVGEVRTRDHQGIGGVNEYIRPT